MPSELTLPQGFLLKAAEASDAAALCAAYERNREHLLPWEPLRSDEFYSEANQRDLLAKAESARALGTGFGWLIWDEERVVGRINLNDVVMGAFCNAHVGYWIASDYQGQGLASAALTEVSGFAADSLKLHRLQAGTLLHNAASQQVLLRNGFTQFGLAEKYLFIAGEWQDHLLFQKILTP